MYYFSGKKSKLAINILNELNKIQINTDPDKSDSSTLVVFGIDPVDKYRYILAHSGLREPEPMYNPRIRQDKYVYEKRMDNIDPRGFRNREGIPDDLEYSSLHYLGPPEKPDELKPATLWVSHRKKVNIVLWNNEKDTVIKTLSDIFSENNKINHETDVPLYPDIWNKERIVTDKLRTRVRSLGPFPSINSVGGAISSSIESSYSNLVNSHSIIRAGIYLYTGDSWVLTGKYSENQFLPVHIKATDRDGYKVYNLLERYQSDDNEHAFDWVHRSSKPILLRYPLSKIWDFRIKKSGISMPPSGGLCIAPIQYDRHDALVVGLLLVSIENVETLSPAFCFITSRIAQSIVGYLTRFFPAPGFPWWPEAKLARGSQNIGITFERDEKDTKSKDNALVDYIDSNIELIIKTMMPDRSRVVLKKLSPGLTGSSVYRMHIYDEKNIMEIPRVLKVGKPQVIGDELHRYYRYVHNKPVGGQSRVDVAMCIPIDSIENTGKNNTNDDFAVAAISYTFVGIDAKPVVWSEWAKDAKYEEIVRGIRMARTHLACWHFRGREEKLDLGEMLATPSAIYKQEKRVEWQRERQILQKTIRYMKKLRQIAKSRRQISHSCIVHGDLHCDNLFALLDKEEPSENKLLGVAIIDWGKVESGKHPSTDIAILLADLVFRVKRDDDKIKPSWALEYIEEYANERGLDVRDIQIVFCYHVMRMLAWGPMEGKDPWIDKDYWEDTLN